MVKEIVVCGDSFACGIGLSPRTCFEDSFGGLVAKHYKVPFTVLARSGCCNYVIYLQALKVVEDYKHKEKPLVLITTTNHSRFIFPSDHADSGYNHYTLEDVEYDLHEPYSKRDQQNRRPLPFEPNSKPKLVSETVSNVMYYLDGKAPNLEYLFTDVKSKFSAIKNYYEELYDDEIKQTYDTALILMMHNCLKEASIPHLIMTPTEHNDRFIDRENYLFNNWGYYAQKYPDKMGSGHCDERGHKEVADIIINRIQGSI